MRLLRRRSTNGGKKDFSARRNAKRLTDKTARCLRNPKGNPQTSIISFNAPRLADSLNRLHRHNLGGESFCTLPPRVGWNGYVIPRRQWRRAQHKVEARTTIETGCENRVDRPR